MTARTELVARIAEVLPGHRCTGRAEVISNSVLSNIRRVIPNKWQCSCGEQVFDHDRHVADVLADVMEGILDAKTPVDTSDAAVSRDELARAWDEGHQEPWKRGMDDCQCGAWASIECGCGKYGTGELLSLTANPYRPSGDER